MTVVFVVTGLKTGGAELMLLRLLERLDKRFHAHVISLTPIGEVGPRISSLGIPVESLGMRPNMPNPFAFFRLVRLLKKLKPDVVQTWMYHADLVGGMAAKFAGVPAVAWGIRNGTLDRKNSKLSTRIVVRACALFSNWVPDRILSCSEAARRIHVDYGYVAEKINVVPNGFDLDRFRPDSSARSSVRMELGVPDLAPLVGLFGRFDPQKNYAGFFEAATLVHRRLPSAFFVLAGEGMNTGNEKIAGMIDSAEIRSTTRLIGLRTDVPRLMAALDVLVSSSSYGEAFPNVLCEAMSCGVPCAVTDVGDSAYIVGETGRVVKSGDMVGLSNAIEELLTLSTAERCALGERARSRVREDFEIGRVVRQYEAFYDALMAAG